MKRPLSILRCNFPDRTNLSDRESLGNIAKRIDDSSQYRPNFWSILRVPIPVEYVREIMSDTCFYGLNVHVQTKTKNMDKYIQNFF